MVSHVLDLKWHANKRGKRTPARPRIGQTLLLIRYVWWQLKAGLALPSRGCALFGIAPSRSTVDAGIGHSSSAVLESVSDLQRFLAEALSALGVLPGLLQAGSLVLSEFLQSI